MISANIFDIKRFSVNDGGGIRTTIFIKGCPLKCIWCHNPEGISREITLWRILARCVNCGGCLSACKYEALSADADKISVDHNKCVLCGECVKACPTGAMKPDAVSMTVDEIMEQIARDELFFSEDGGVTLSGGECTASPEFSINVLNECKKRGINTAIETCMHASEAIMREFARIADSIIADIKLIDPIRHKIATGVSNELILTNFRLLAKAARDILIRVPLIPGYTDDEENIIGIAKHIAGVDKSIPVELINFNPMCEGKYESLHRSFINSETMKPFSKQKLSELAGLMEPYGLKVKY